MEQEKEKAIKNILKSNPKFLLISCSLIIEGRRKFLDVPFIVAENSFPNRQLIFTYVIEYFGIERNEDTIDMINKIYSEFAILCINRFKNKQEYDEFMNSSNETTEFDSLSNEIINE